jgi:putative ABC transport system ATP-binding protein
MVTHDPELARRAHRNVHVMDGKVTDLQPFEPRPLMTAGEERAARA